MKRVLFVAMLMLLIPALSMADGKNKKAADKKPAAAADNNKEIHWITDMNELQAKMKANPKKVYIDMYTDWCGWCKKMDATTFQNPDLIKYMNNNFYAVKFDAERKDAFNFNGKEYHFEPQYRAHTFAVEMMQGKLSYPTAVIMIENFQSPTPVAGYMTVPQLEYVLSYFGDNAYRRVKWEEYQKTYHPAWDKGQAPDMTPPAAH